MNTQKLKEQCKKYNIDTYGFKYENIEKYLEDKTKEVLANAIEDMDIPFNKCFVKAVFNMVASANFVNALEDMIDHYSIVGMANLLLNQEAEK